MTAAATTAELFVELRCEELPARFVQPTATQLAARLTRLLKGVPHGAVTTWATPRRVAVSIRDVAAGRPQEEQLVTGPPMAAAKRDGTWTRAAQGFARGRGVSVDDLEVVEGPKGPVVAARVRTGGEQTADLVAAGLEDAVLGIEFDRTMRWGSAAARWARPIHGVVALYAGAPIAASVAGVATSTETVGHRLHPTPFAVTGAATYVADLLVRFVVADRGDRRDRISTQLEAAASAVGARVGELDLIDEVVDLVEWPQVVTARFSEDLLALPERLLVESMGVHQRVFPLFDAATGALTHRFLVVTNHPPAAVDPESARIIAEGNTKVLAARFNDAKFFYAEDRKRSLADHGAGLDKMRWIRKGGTMAEKQARVAALAGALAPRFSADPAAAQQAGALCKADLMTQMVGEFPKLQGHVGRLLAGFDGHPAAAALAIEEHYRPRYSSDALPTSPEGTTVAVADRVDTLVGTFSRGLKPKGSADPLGLRRAAGGLVDLLIGAGTSGDLPSLFADAGAGEHAADLTEFTLARFRSRQQEAHATDVIDAVLATGVTDVVALAARVQALSAAAATPAFQPLRATFKRLMNIAGDHDSATVDADALTEPAARDLHAAFAEVQGAARSASEAGDYAGALAQLSALGPAVDRLFAEVMVMADDPAVRANRLGLLRAIADEFGRIADFQHLSS